MPDVVVGPSNPPPGCTVYTFTPSTPEAQAWLHEHVAGEQSWLGASLVVEHRYVSDLIAGLVEAGFEVAQDSEV